jgi:hypothetical protein
MEKITAADGGERYTTEREFSPEERLKNLERKETYEGYYVKYLNEGKDPTHPDTQKELWEMVDEEMERRGKAATSNIIPFPKRDGYEKGEKKGEEEEMRKAA